MWGTLTPKIVWYFSDTGMNWPAWTSPGAQQGRQQVLADVCRSKGLVRNRQSIV